MVFDSKSFIYTLTFNQVIKSKTLFCKRKFGLKAKKDEEKAVSYELVLVGKSAVREFFFPDRAKLPADVAMPIWDHLDELRARLFIAGIAAVLAIIVCFYFSKDLVMFLEAPVAEQGIRFLQLSPGEFFFTTLKVSGYAGLLLSTPTILYQVGSWVSPGMTVDEKKLLTPILLGSSLLFLLGLLFSNQILAPAAFKFFITFADGAVESLWSIDRYFEFNIALMLSAGLTFQVPVVQIMLGQSGIVNSKQMFRIWRYVVVGATIVAAILTPSTDPLTQILLAIPLVGLYMGGVLALKIFEGNPEQKKTNRNERFR